MSAHSMSARAQYQEIIADSANAVISVDANLKICLFNDAAVTLFGYQRTEVMGASLDILLPIAARAGHGQHIAQFTQSGVHAKFMNDRRPLSGVAKDGREVPLEISIIEHKEPGPARFSAIIRDLSERQAYEQRLQASERKFRGLFETSSAVLMLADADGHILDINPAGSSFFACARQGLLDHSLLGFNLWGDPETVETVAITLKTAIRHGKSGALLPVTKNGNTRRLDFIAHRLGTAQPNDPTALFIEGRDVTPLFEAHQALTRGDGGAQPH